MSKIAENLKHLMEEKNLNKFSLEKKAGLGLNAVSHIMLGKSTNPKMSTLEALAKALDCSIDFLVNGSTASKPKLVESDSQIREAIWNHKLSMKCTELVNSISEKKNIKLNTEQAEIVLQNLYNYMVRKALNEQGKELNLDVYEPDYTYADWIIERAYNSD